MAQGKAFLVGAGPGSADLVTVRGRELLSRAEVVVYDAPCDEALLRVAPASAERIPVGGWPEAGRMRQADINALLVERVRAGKQVVRLKSGDPYMFGRGGDEALALEAAGFGFEVVPGVTCGLAAAAFAGIPITQRGVSSEALFAFVQSGGDPAAWGLDLDRLAQSRESTLIFHLEPSAVGPLAAELVRHGMDPQTPSAVVESAGGPAQRTFAGALRELGERAREARAPVVALIGPAVALRERLAWAERRPLSGRTIVLAGAGAQAAELAALVAEQGGVALACPCTAWAPPASFEELDRALAALAGYGWLVLSGEVAVEHLLSRLAQRGRDVRALAGPRIAAIGAAAARALSAVGIVADRVLERGDLRELLQAVSKEEVALRRLLYLGAQDEVAEVQRELGAAGVEGEACACYQEVRTPVDPAPLRARLERGEVSAVVLASPLAVQAFAAGLRPGEAQRLFAGACVAVLGQGASRAARELGLEVGLAPEEPTFKALARALAARLARGSADGPRP